MGFSHRSSPPRRSLSSHDVVAYGNVPAISPFLIRSTGFSSCLSSPHRTLCDKFHQMSWVNDIIHAGDLYRERQFPPVPLAITYPTVTMGRTKCEEMEIPLHTGGPGAVG